MAEAFLQDVASDRFDVESAGLEPGIINPLVVESMKEIGIDISKNKTKRRTYRYMARQGVLGALRGMFR